MHRFEAYLLLKGKGLTINEVSDAGGDIKTTRDKFIVHRNKMKLDERNMTSLIITMTPERSFSCAPGKFYEEHGNYIEINHVRYTVSSMPVRGRLGAYAFNYFQSLELK